MYWLVLVFSFEKSVPISSFLIPNGNLLYHLREDWTLVEILFVYIPILVSFLITLRENLCGYFPAVGPIKPLNWNDIL